jgi:hypothetical protein
MFSPSRLSLAALLAASCLFASLPASAQSSETKPADKPADKPAQAQPVDPDAQRKADEFTQAAREISGPAGNAECVFLGKNVVGLLFRNDMDTAFRHLDLYDRFGCPGPHIQSAFRCVLRQTASIDPKSGRGLTDRLQSCWINPVATTAAAAATQAPSAVQAAPAKSEPAPAAAKEGATSTPGANQATQPKTSGTPSR